MYGVMLVVRSPSFIKYNLSHHFMNKKLSLSLFIILSFCFSLSHHTSIATEDDIVQIPFNEIQIAEQLYQQGKLTEAIASLKTSINTYQAQEKIVPQIYGLRNLSLIYLQQENWQATQTNIIKAIELTKQIENSQQQSLLLSLCLEIQGQLQLAIDKPEVALSTWQQSSQLALSRKDMNQLLKSEIKQVQALQEMGLYAQAFSKLNELEPQLNKAPASLVTAKAWQTMGGLLGKIDRSAEAESALNKALAIVDSLEHPQAQADILISQGNLAQAQQNFETALNFYRQATTITNNPSLQLQAYLAQLNLLVTQDKPEKISSLVTPITTIINNSSPSKNLVNQRINLATSLIRLKNKQNNPLIVEQLSQGYQEAQQISYRRGEADG